MRRQLLTIALTGLFGALLLSSDASACCHKKRCATPCATVAVAPCPPPVCAQPVCAQPVCKPKCRLFAGLCHRKRACAPVSYCAPVAYGAAPMMYPSAQYPSGQY